MHFQSATPCVRHDHALSARGGDFIAWSLSLTGLVNAYWPDWHTSSRKLTKWCLTDNFGTIRELSPLTSGGNFYYFCFDGPHSYENNIYSFFPHSLPFVIFSCITEWSCSWLVWLTGVLHQEPGLDLRRCTSLVSWPSQISLAWHPFLGIVISKVILDSFFILNSILLLQSHRSVLPGSSSWMGLCPMKRMNT